MAKTKTKPKSKKPSANESAATTFADLQYGPAISQINAAFGTAKDQFGSDIDAAARGGESGRAYALGALPTVQKSYSNAKTETGSDDAFVNAELAKLGPSADVFKGAATKSQGAFHDRITAAGARAEQSLRDRAAAATAGEQFAKNQARADYRKTTGALQQQLLDLKSQAGKAAANKLSELLQADLDRQNKLDVATIGADATTGAAKIRSDAQKEKDAAKKKRDKKDVYGNTLDQRRSRRSTFSNAVTLAGSINAKGNKSADQIYRLLLVQSPTLNNTIARAAADAAVNGGTINSVASVALRKALRRLGIMVTAPTPPDRGPQRTPATSNTPGQSRPT